MAGNWIKAEKSTINKPELFKIARILGKSRYEIYGMLMHFWMWADDLTVDGRVDGIVDGDVDALVNCEGFASALMSVNWLQQSKPKSKKPSIIIPNFQRHMSESAKKRAVKSERQRRYRNKHDENNVDGDVDGDVDGSVDTAPSTGASTREEKRRYKKKETKTKPLDFPFGSPEFMDAWSGLLESRRKNRSVPTEKAKQMILDKVKRLSSNEAQAIELLDTAIENGWKTVYPPKNGFQSSPTSNPNIPANFSGTYIDPKELVNRGR